MEQGDAERRVIDFSWRDKVVQRLDQQDAVLAQQHEVLTRIETAMFAKDELNEFGSPGVMTVMQKINRHVDVMCSLAVALKRIGEGIKWAAGIITAVVVVYGAWATITKL